MASFSYKVNIPVFLLKDDGVIVAYTPALNLGTCGKTQAEAKIRLGGAIELFFSELVGMGTLDKALKELGWKKVDDQKFAVPRPSEQPAKIQRNIPTHLLSRRSMNVRVPVAA
ncbi:hypothetical protein EPO15_13250 [bacterium]|nr:MAG: hypothetical protein EPO15_13250 [bacterium]